MELFLLDSLHLHLIECGPRSLSIARVDGPVLGDLVAQRVTMISCR